MAGLTLFFFSCNSSSRSPPVPSSVRLFVRSFVCVYQRCVFNAEHLLWSEFSEMVRIRTILQISVRIRSEFAQKVRIFQFLSLSLPKNLEKEALA